MTKLLSTALFIVFFVSGSVAWAGGGAIKVASNTPFKDPTVIDNKIIDECDKIGFKLARYLNEFATEFGVETVLVDSVDPKADGKVLVVHITSAVSGGNNWIGHSKAMSAKAELFENGQPQGFVNFTRDSGGGFGAAFKGSCSVLGRCSKALGKDIAEWLRNRQ
jgi:hypothetical protein